MNELSPLLEQAAQEGELDLAPGSLLAVVQHGKILALRAHGTLDSDQQTVDASTRFRIASMTKSFLVATALKLQETGRFDVSQPISTYLPEAQFFYRGEAQEIPCWMFLANCSGLAEDNAWGDRHIGISADDLLAIVSEGLRLSAPVGMTYQYSNVGMALVGLAITRATQQPIEEVIETEILQPLALVSTSFRPDDATARGFRSFDSGTSFIPEPYVGNGALDCIGGLYSTVQDVATWVDFLQAGIAGDAARDHILSSASRRLMQRGFTQIPVLEKDFALTSTTYSLGIRTDIHRDFGRIVHHSGGLPGFSSYMRWQISTGLATIAFCNTDAVSAAKSATSLLDAVLEQGTEDIWEETQEAAAFIEELILAQDLSALADSPLVSENLLQDIPLETRQSRFDELLRETGRPLPEQAPTANRAQIGTLASEYRWVVNCENGQLEVFIALVGLTKPLLQTLTLKAKD